MFLKGYPLTLILKQKTSLNYGCLNLHDIYFCIKPELYTVLSGIHILTCCYTTSKVGTKFPALKPPALLLSEFENSSSSPIQFKMKSYAKLSNSLFKYSNPTEYVLLWMILGIKYTTKVKLVISIPYQLPVLIYVCIF